MGYMELGLGNRVPSQSPSPYPIPFRSDFDCVYRKKNNGGHGAPQGEENHRSA
jgi:hypothetical protein